MRCKHYKAGECHSCQWLSHSYQQQLELKQQHLQQLLQPLTISSFLPPVSSLQWGFRNKAKMVVSGSVERPILGIVTHNHLFVDLCDCPLYPFSMQAIFPVLKQFILRAGLTPYHIERKRGELKFILVTQNDTGDLMVRFVLRSQKKLMQIQQQLLWLTEQLPKLQVVSVNLQPIHMAILEGETEIYLTEERMLAQPVDNIPLYMQPGSFFQTNLLVTKALYTTARQWTSELHLSSVWDLFCGVGGFGFFCTKPTMTLTGIEISPEAIECATRTAQQLNLKQMAFQALDSTQFTLAMGNIPDLIIVNPPRRGIGAELCHYLTRVCPDYILYSSCNAETLVKDLGLFSNYRIEKVQLFDMFPHTSHYEVLVLLVKEDK